MTCLVFLRGRFVAAGAKGSCATQVLAVVGAIAYSLTSYVTGYSSNIMWIDGVIMAPLACLGVYRLVRGRGCAALFASCACAILFNWYTGYMVCFFTIFYFFYEYARLRIEESERACDEGELRLGNERKCADDAGKRNGGSANEPARIAPKNRKLAGHPLIHLGLRYAATMILAVGASAVILFPTLIALLGGKGSGAGLAALAGTIFSLNPFDYANFFAIGTRPGIIVANATPCDRDFSSCTRRRRRLLRRRSQVPRPAHSGCRHYGHSCLVARPHPAEHDLARIRARVVLHGPHGVSAAAHDGGACLRGHRLLSGQ